VLSDPGLFVRPGAGSARLSTAANATTKGASVTLVRALAPQLPGDITVNAICPSFVDTPMIAGARDHIVSQGRMVASPDLVADAVEQIIADDRTGQVWIV